MSTFYNTNIDIAEYNKWANKYANDIRNLSDEQKKNAFLRYQYRMKHGESALGAFDKAKSFDEKVALYNGNNVSQINNGDNITQNNYNATIAQSNNATSKSQKVVDPQLINGPFKDDANQSQKEALPWEVNANYLYDNAHNFTNIINNPYYNEKQLNENLGINYNKDLNEYQELNNKLSELGSIPQIFVNGDFHKLSQIGKLCARVEYLRDKLQKELYVNRAIGDKLISIQQAKTIDINPEKTVYIDKNGNFIIEETPTKNLTTRSGIDNTNEDTRLNSLYQAAKSYENPTIIPGKMVDSDVSAGLSRMYAEQAAYKDYKDRISDAKAVKIKNLSQEQLDKYIKQYNDKNTYILKNSKETIQRDKKVSEQKWEHYYKQNPKEAQEKLNYIKKIAQETNWYRKTRDEKVENGELKVTKESTQDWLTEQDYDNMLYAYTEAYESALSKGLSEEEADQAGQREIAVKVEAAAYKDMPWYKAFGNATVQAINSTITTALSTVGMISSALNPVNWFSGEYGYRVMHNPLSEWASEKMEKGLFTSDEEWEKYGINTFANPDDVTDYSIGNFFKHTVSETWGQSGFTWGSALGGRALGLATKQLFKGVSKAFKIPAKIQQMTNLASKIEQLEGAEKRFAKIQNRINKAENLVHITIPGVIGTNEGIIEGLQTEKNVLRDGYSELTDNILGYLQQKQFDIIGLQEQAKKTVGNDPEKLVEYYLSLVEAGVNGGDDPTYYNMFKDVKAQIEDAAATAGTQNLMMNSMINGLFHTLTAKMWATKRTQEAFRNVRNTVARKVGKVSPKLGRFMSTKEKYIAKKIEGTERVKVSPYNTWYRPIITKANAYLGIALPEGAEEYLQSVSDAAAEGGAMANIHQFMKERYNGGSPIIGETFGIEWAAARQAATDAMVDPESWKQAFYGALGALMPSPFTGLRGKYVSYKTDKDGNLIRGKDGKYETTIKLWNRKNAVDRDGNVIKNEDGTVKKESILKTIARAVPFQSNAVMHYKSVQQRAWDRISQAKAIEDWINEDEKHLEMFKSIQGILSIGETIQMAEDYNAGMERRDAMFRGFVHSALMISQLKGTAYYDSVMQLLNNMQNVNQLTEEQQESLVNSIADPSMSKEDKLKLATDRASFVLEMLEQIDGIKDSLEKQLGILTPDQAAGLVYGKLSNENFKHRHKQLEDRIKNIASSKEFTSSRENGVNTQEQVDDLVKYGSKSIVDAKTAEQEKTLEKKQEELKSLKEKLKQEKSKKKADRKNISKIKEDITKIESEISNINKQLKTLKNRKSANSDEIVLNEQEIMSLPAVQRAMLLNSNPSNFSEEQARIIENVKAQGRLLDPEFDDIVKDSAALLNNIRRSMIEYSLALKNPTIVSELGTREARIAQAQYRQLRYESIAKISNYEDWVAAVREAESNSDVDQVTLQRVLRSINPKFYERYKEGRDDLLTMMSLIANDPSLETIDDRQQELLYNTLEFLRAKGVSLTDKDAVVSALSEINEETGKTLIQEYIEQADENIQNENEKIGFDSLEEIFTIYNAVVDAYQKEIERRVKEAEANKPLQDPVNSKESKDVVKNKSRKQKNREYKKAKKEKEKAKKNKKKEELEQAEQEKQQEKQNLKIARTFIYNKITTSRKLNDQQRKDLTKVFDESQAGHETEESLLQTLRNQANKLISDNEEGTAEASNGQAILDILDSYDDYKESRKIQEKANQKEEVKKSLARRVLEKISGSLRQAQIDTMLDKEEDAVDINNRRWLTTQDDFVEISRLANSSTMVGLSMEEYINSGNASPSMQQYWEDNEVTKYLQEHSDAIHGKTIYFYSPSAITERRKNNIEELDAPLVAIIEDENGKVVLETKDGPKHFQPIAIMPSSFNSTLSATRNTKMKVGNAYGIGRSFYIRSNIKGTDQIIQDENGKNITSVIKKISSTRRVISLGSNYTPSSNRVVKELQLKDPKFENKTIREIMKSPEYLKARRDFIDSYVRKYPTGEETTDQIKAMQARSFRNEGGVDEGLHDFTRIDEARSKYTDKSLAEVVEAILNDPEANYDQLYAGQDAEDGFNSRATYIGKRIQETFKNVFKFNSLLGMSQTQQQEKLQEYEKALTRAFVNANGIFFNPTLYSFKILVQEVGEGENKKAQATIFLINNSKQQSKVLATVEEGEISDKDTAKLMANFFYNGGYLNSEGKEVKTPEGTEAKPLIDGVNWQLDDKELAPFAAGYTAKDKKEIDHARSYLARAYDDGLLGERDNKIEVNVSSVQLMAPEGSNKIQQDTSIKTTNKDNAESNSISSNAASTKNGLVDSDTGASLDGHDSQQEEARQLREQQKAQQAFEALKEEAKNWALSESRKFYERNGSNPHARVTSVIAADRFAERDKDGKPNRFDEESSWAIPSSAVGNAVDAFLRDVFEGEYDGLSETQLQEKLSKLPIAQYSEWRNLYNYVSNFRDNLIRNGYHFESIGFTVNGVLPVYQNGKQIGTLPVAGTLDLIAYDAEGNIIIFDFKTHHNSNISELKGKWARQTSVYKTLIQQFLESKGIQANFAKNSLKIFHIHSDYDTAKTNSYKIAQDGTLIYRQNESTPYTEYKSTRFKEAGEISIAEVASSIQFDDLLEEEKALVKRDDNEPPSPPKGPENNGPENTGPQNAPNTENTEETPKTTSSRRGRGMVKKQRGGQATTNALNDHISLEIGTQISGEGTEKMKQEAQEKQEKIKKLGINEEAFCQLSKASQEQLMGCA